MTTSLTLAHPSDAATDESPEHALDLHGLPSSPPHRQCLPDVTSPSGLDQDLWESCRKLIRDSVNDAVWQAWFTTISCDRFSPCEVVLRVPSAIAKDTILRRFLSTIAGACASVLDTAPAIDVVVGSISSSPQPSTAPLHSDIPDNHPPPEPTHPGKLSPSGTSSVANTYFRQPPHRTNELPTPPGTPFLDSRFTFDNFVIGDSNRFAHAAALSVSRSPGHSYNPLFVHGGNGLGKTHLLRSIASYIASHHPDKLIRYVSSEQFVNEFIDAIRTNHMGDFKRRYRRCDVLLIDDIQFLGGKEQTQEEFFHTFNDLYGASKQIVLTSDRPPNAISTLEQRLQSRFLSGLITDIQPPELETRIAILKHSASRESTTVPADVLDYIATTVTTNIRELEGALLRVTAYSTLTDQPISLPLAESILSDISRHGRNRLITPDTILQTVSLNYGFSIADLIGHNRNRPLTTARQVAMYLFRQLTNYSYPVIAQYFSNRDHTTVMHAIEKISKLVATDNIMANQILSMTRNIQDSDSQ